MPIKTPLSNNIVVPLFQHIVIKIPVYRQNYEGEGWVEVCVGKRSSFENESYGNSLFAGTTMVVLTNS